MSTTTFSFPPPLTATSPPPSSVPTSIIIVVIIIASAVIVTVSIYLILKFFSKRFHSSFHNDVVFHSPHSSNRHVSPLPLLDQLPIFTFSSVSGNLTGGDCAVCLSKFQPHDKLRLLPLCCHAFHCECIDTWISTNQTCPLCRSTVFPSEADILEKFSGESFRVEIGSVSRRRGGNNNENDVVVPNNAVERTYSIGSSFEYVMDGDGYEVSVGSIRMNGSNDRFSDKEEEVLASEVGGVSGRSWLREYVDRVASTSSRALSFRGSGRFFSRRRDDLEEDLEANRAGEEISELFRWLSGV